jgi:hypothetical protein
MTRSLFGLGCALAMVGCHDASASPAAMDAGTDAQPTAEEAVISLNGFVYTFTGVPFGGPIVAGAQVCQDEPRLCATTDSEGRFILSGLQPEREIVLTYRKDGFLPMLQALVTPRWSSGLAAHQLVPNDIDLSGFNIALRAAGRPEVDLSNAGVPSVSFGAAPGFDGRLHVRLDPDPGSEPFYFLLPGGESALTVPPDGTANFGVFVNVEPREDYELVYEHDDGDCVYVAGSIAGWPSKQGRSNATRVPVRDGYTTYVTAEFCSFGTEPDADR